MSLGQAIKQLRAARGWSLGTLSYQVEISTTTIHQLEKGQIQSLTVPRFIRLAQAFGLNMQQLATLSGYLPPTLGDSRPVWQLEALTQQAVDLFRQLPEDEQEEMLARLRLEVNLHERRSTDEE